MFNRIFTHKPTYILNDKAQPKQVCLKTHQDTLDKCDKAFEVTIGQEITAQLDQQRADSAQAWSERKYSRELTKAKESPETAARLEELRAASPEYTAASASLHQTDSKFNLYMRKESIEGSQIHQDMRRNAKIIFATGVFLTAAITSLAVTHVITLGTTTAIVFVVAAVFFTIIGLLTLLVSYYLKRGKEVVEVKYSDVTKLYQPIRGAEKAFTRMTEDSVCYIPKNVYKRFEKQLYLENHPPKAKK